MSSVLDIYTQDYASQYDKKFLDNAYDQASVAYKLKLLNQILDKDSKWLDVACGTGYMLSKFPEISRGGIDLSPAMIEQAKKSNPGPGYFEVKDFKEEHPELINQWSLVSCMWGAYGYVNTLEEAKQVIFNLSNWIKPGDNLFLPILDISDLRPQNPVAYITDLPVYGGLIRINACSWSWIEADGKTEHQMLNLNHELIIDLLRNHFERIEIRRFRAHRDRMYEKILIGIGKKDPENTIPAQLIVHPIEGISLPAVNLSAILFRLKIRMRFLFNQFK